jgi:hypothetical protein
MNLASNHFAISRKIAIGVDALPLWITQLATRITSNKRVALKR